MSDRQDIERLLRAHYARTAKPHPTAERLAAILDQTARETPRPRWLAELRGDGFGRATAPVTNTATRLAWALLLLGLLASLAAGLLLVGGGGPRLGVIIGPPSPTRTDQAAPSPSASHRPRPTLPPSSPDVAPAPSAAVDPQGQVSGQLAYVRSAPEPWSPGSSDLYVTDANGANARILVPGVDGGADWSPSGRYLTVARSTPDTFTTFSIVDLATGHEVGRIDGGENPDSRWSPAEDVLAVVSQAKTGARIRLFRPDGSLVRRLQVPVGVTTIVNGIDWSPDGRSLVVSGCIGCQDNKYDDTPNLTWDLWIVSADGGRPKRLTDSPFDIESGPAWSPDGSTIAFAVAGWCNPQTGSCANSNIWAIAPSGANERLLVPNASQPIWSPDGSHFLYEPNDQTLGANDLDIYAANADGSSPRRLTATPGEDGARAWSPDGKFILFLHVDAGDPMTQLPIALWSMKSDGSDAVELASDSGYGNWRPAPSAP